MMPGKGRMRRRDVLGLLGGGATTLLASCVAAPTTVPQIPITAVPKPTDDPNPPPTLEPTRAPTPRSTSLPTGVPAPQLTGVPTPQLTDVPTPQPTAEPTPPPTVVTPPALAAAVAAAMLRDIQRNVFPGGVALVRHRGAQIMLAAYGFSSK